MHSDSNLDSETIAQAEGLLPELDVLLDIAKKRPQFCRVTEHGRAAFSTNARRAPSNDAGQTSLPIFSFQFGRTNTAMPNITLVGGIHGLERVGTRVVMSYLETLIARLEWDVQTQSLLNKVSINFLPLMNPVGMYRQTRSNGNGVDLMRNSPIDSKERPSFMVGGQSYSRHLPWFRGREGLELENRILIAFLKENSLHAPFSMVLDCHSGFGFRDRIWFPYAYRKRPPREIANYYQLSQLLNQTLPNHNYIVEPQSKQYTTHGDLWDHICKIVKHEFSKPFMSLTLEMGSWKWLKKQPLGMFSKSGFFNPGHWHRWKRAQRRHIAMLDFLVHATASYQNWLPTGEKKKVLRKQAIDYWYR